MNPEEVGKKLLNDVERLLENVPANVLIPQEWIDEVHETLIGDATRADAGNIRIAIEQAISQGESRWSLMIPNLHGTTPDRIKQICKHIAETDQVPAFLANRVQVSSTETKGTYLLELRLFAADF
jgi:hypothetical protein